MDILQKHTVEEAVRRVIDKLPGILGQKHCPLKDLSLISIRYPMIDSDKL